MKKIKWGKVLATIAVVCICWVTFLLTAGYFRSHRVYETATELYSTGCEAVFYSDGTYAVRNTGTGKITLKKIDWIVASGDGSDSLVVFSRDRKRGYFDRYTGEVVIPEQYPHAWIFSEGIAAVVKDDKVGFIDHRGNTVIDFKFPYLKDNEKRTDFVFRNGYCSMYDATGKCGLIDKKGEWVLKPSYDYIKGPEYGKRVLTDNGSKGVLDDSLRVIIPAVYKDIALTPGYVIVTKPDGTRMQLSYTGEVLNPMLYDLIETLYYGTGEYGEDDTEIMKPTGIYSYYVGGYYGLMDASGKLLTPPLYRNIYVVNKNLFRGTLDDLQSDALIDRNGKII